MLKKKFGKLQNDISQCKIQNKSHVFFLWFYDLIVTNEKKRKKSSLFVCCTEV